MARLIFFCHDKGSFCCDKSAYATIIFCNKTLAAILSDFTDAGEVGGGEAREGVQRNQIACEVILDYNVDNIFESMESLKLLTVHERIFVRKVKFMYKVSHH